MRRGRGWGGGGGGDAGERGEGGTGGGRRVPGGWRRLLPARLPGCTDTRAGERAARLKGRRQLRRLRRAAPCPRQAPPPPRTRPPAGGPLPRRPGPGRGVRGGGRGGHPPPGSGPEAGGPSRAAAQGAASPVPAARGLRPPSSFPPPPRRLWLLQGVEISTVSAPSALPTPPLRARTHTRDRTWRGGGGGGQCWRRRGPLRLAPGRRRPRPPRPRAPGWAGSDSRAARRGGSAPVLEDEARVPRWDRATGAGRPRLFQNLPRPSAAGYLGACHPLTGAQVDAAHPQRAGCGDPRGGGVEGKRAAGRWLASMPWCCWRGSFWPNVSQPAVLGTHPWHCTRTQPSRSAAEMPSVSSTSHAGVQPWLRFTLVEAYNHLHPPKRGT